VKNKLWNKTLNEYLLHLLSGNSSCKWRMMLSYLASKLWQFKRSSCNFLYCLASFLTFWNNFATMVNVYSYFRKHIYHFHLFDFKFYVGWCFEYPNLKGKYELSTMTPTPS
jgi:hypothetical protein